MQAGATQAQPEACPPRWRVRAAAKYRRASVRSLSTGRLKPRVKEPPRQEQQPDYAAAENGPGPADSPVDSSACIPPASVTPSQAPEPRRKPTGAGPRSSKRQSTAALDEAALVRELNAAPGSTTSAANALMQAIGEDAWSGVQDIHEFAQVRSITDPLPPTPARRSGRGSGPLTRGVSEAQGPLPSVVSSQQLAFASYLPPGTRLEAPGSKKAQLLVTSSFMRRNAEVMAALAVMGRTPRLRAGSRPANDPTAGSETYTHVLPVDGGGATEPGPPSPVGSWSPDTQQGPQDEDDDDSSALETSAGPGVISGGPRAKAGWAAVLGDDVVIGAGAETNGAGCSTAAAGLPAPHPPPSSQEGPPALAQPRDPSRAASRQAEQAGVPPCVLQPRPTAAPRLRAALRPLNDPKQVLDFASLLFPTWAHSGCRLAAPTVLAMAAHPPGSVGPLGVAPSPNDAALLLAGLARACRAAHLGQAARLELGRDARVAGLLEALRTRPPRLSPEQEVSSALANGLVAAFSAAAKAWWVETPGTGLDLPPAVGAAPKPPAQVNGHAPPLPTGGLRMAAAPGMNGSSPADSYGHLLARYLQEDAEDAGIQAVREARHQAVVSGLWAMAVLAGPYTWQLEMEGLLAVAGLGGTSWLFAPREAGSVVWALATARHWSHQLTRITRALAAAGGTAALAPEETCRVVWGLATLNQPLAALLPKDGGAWAWRAPDRGTAGDVRSFSAQQLAVLCWGLAVGGLTRHPSFSHAWKALLGRVRDLLPPHGAATVSGSTAVFTQVWQVALELLVAGLPEGASPPGSDVVAAAIHAGTRGLGGHASAAEAADAEALLRAAHAAFIGGGKGLRESASARGGANSGYQRQIANALVALRHMHVVEDVSSGYAVDVSLPAMRVAIEADGPSHFSRVPGPASVSPWPLGATALKHRHLRALGWAVISITIKEWEAAGGPAGQQRLLSKRITEAVQERTRVTRPNSAMHQSDTEAAMADDEHDGEPAPRRTQRRRERPRKQGSPAVGLRVNRARTKHQNAGCSLTAITSVASDGAALGRCLRLLSHLPTRSLYARQRLQVVHTAIRLLRMGHRTHEQDSELSTLLRQLSL